MSKTDILDHPELRKVWDTLESATRPVEWDDLDTLNMPGPRATGRPNGVWVAVVVFVGTLVIGALTWQLSGNGAQPLAAGEAAAAYFSFASEGALVLGEDPLILQPAPGPEPQFDTSALGTEVPLVPASTVADIPNGFLATTDNSADTAVEAPLVEHCVRTESRPILHIGYVSEIDARLLIYGTVSDGRGDYIFDGGPGLPQYAVAIACDGFSGYPHGVSGHGAGFGNSGFMNVEVSPLTSVVTVSTNEGERLWQRPVAGWALFPYKGGTVTIDALDAAGSVIGHWEQSG
ncbi:MAG TPA: hypothetical protein VJA46_07440 [Acidimicrobiia bacterium]|nr:hypothetical protein [Acidimicrobiia bacterium]